MDIPDVNEYSAQYNMVDGYNNNVANVNHAYVIGANNNIKGKKFSDATKDGVLSEKDREIAKKDDNLIVIGDNHTLANDVSNNIILGTADKTLTTSASNVVMIGHNADAQKEGGVALGADSVAAIDKGAVGYDPTTKKASTNTSSTWKSTAAAVSVGDASKKITRQITNVAAGTQDTDAVNVAQLKAISSTMNTDIAASKTHFYSVKSTDAKAKNYNNDGATAANALAAGVGANADKASAVAIGDTAYAGSANGVAIGTGSWIRSSDGKPNPNGGDVAIGQDSHVDSYVNQGGSIALGQNARVENMYGNTEKSWAFGQTEFDDKNIPLNPGNEAGGVAIGRNSFARTGSLMVGSHMYKGAIADIGEVDGTDSQKLRDTFNNINMTTLGTNSFNNGTFATVTGAYSATTAKKKIQNFAATVDGSLNSIESYKYQDKDAADNSGVASSIVGTANRIANSNNTTILGAGNEVTNSLTDIEAPTEGGDSAKALQDTLKGKLQQNEKGAIVVSGIGNTVDSSHGVSVLGSRNAVKTTDNIQLLGDNREVTKANGSVIIGSADSKMTTSVTDATILGHNANVEKTGGVALGAGSVASREAGVTGYDPATKTDSTDSSATWKATDAAVSVGKADGTMTRQITGVAAGTKATDAVNVAQLKQVSDGINNNINANKVHYYSVKSKYQDDKSNYNNNGAKGQESIVLGIASSSDAGYSTVIGMGSSAKKRGTSQASGMYDTVVGQYLDTTGSYNSVFGTFYQNGSIQQLTKVYGDRNTVLGAGNIVGIGKNNTKVKSDENVVIGLNNSVEGSGSIIVGNATTVNGQDVMNATSFGHVNTIYDKQEGGGQWGVALGNNLTVKGEYALAVGNNSTAQGDQTVAVGYNANASVAGGAAIGSGSVASVDKGVEGYKPNSSVDTSTDPAGTWKSTDAAVSVGKADGSMTRQITGVAAGTNATDAVNVAQLKAAQTHFYSVNSTDEKAGNYNNDGAKGKNSLAAGVGALANGSNSVAIGTKAKAQNDALAVGESASAGNNSIAIGMNASAGYSQNMALGYYANVAKGVTNSTALGYGSQVTKRDILKSDGNDGVISVGKSVGQSGEKGMTRRIINVKAGVKATDAANVSQLTELKEGEHISITDSATPNEKGQTVKTISVKVDGQIEKGNTGILSGDTVYKEVHVDKDGNYIKSGYTVAENLNALDGKVKTNADNIEKNGQAIEKNSARIDTNAKNIEKNGQAIEKNSARIDTNAQNIEKNGQAIEKNSARIDTNTQNIEKNGQAIEKNSARIDTNAQNIEKNGQAIEKNSARIDTNAQNIEKNSARIDTNAKNIEKNGQAIEKNSARIDTNAKNIEKNGQAIEKNSARIDTNAKNIEKNGQAIEKNSARIDTNAKNIEKNSQAIEKNSARIDTNAKNIEKNSQAIEKNSARIDTNAKNIEKNSQAIEKNSARIDTNAKNIEKNSQAIEKNSARIDTNAKNIEKNSQAIEKNSARIDTNAKNIEKNGQAIEKNSARIDTNSKNIEKNGQAIEKNSARIDTNSKNIEKNGQAIEKNSARIDTNAQNIEKNGQAIEKNSARIDTNAKNIEKNGQAIEKNSARIDTNAKNIEKNGQAIEKNSARIDTNAKNIEKNGQAIEKNSARIDTNSKNIEKNSQAIEKNSARIDTNSKNIEKNSQAIEKNSARIDTNSKNIEKNGKNIEILQETKADTNLSNITDAGKTVINNLAKKAVKVKAGSKNVNVTPSDVENGPITYTVDIAQDLNVNSITSKTITSDSITATTVTSDTVKTKNLSVSDVASIGDVTINKDGQGTVNGLKNTTWDPTKITSGQAATEDQLKAATKNAVNYDGDDSKTITLRENTTIKNVADTTIEQGSKNAVNAGTVYNETRVAKDGNFVKQSNTAGENLSALDNQVTANTESIYHMNGRISDLDNRVNKVGAGAAALAALHPLDFDPDDKWDFAVGYGNYRNANSVALGAFYRPNEDTMFSLGTNFGNGENMFNAGLSFKIGQGGSGITTSKTAMAKKIESLENTVDQQDKKIAELEALVKEQGEMIRQYVGKK
ncbi:YadA-like family protein [Megasphaera elsdenii]|uniref:YadA-like family protein n=1 Tax=Megasphaera elsdenii TaxID=907 RepID=UPI0036F195ED